MLKTIQLTTYCNFIIVLSMCKTPLNINVFVSKINYFTVIIKILSKSALGFQNLQMLFQVFNYVIKLYFLRYLDNNNHNYIYNLK